MTSPSGSQISPSNSDPTEIFRDNNNTEAPPPLLADLTQYAFFFDLDGTLAPIVERPEAASVPATTRHLLASLRDRSGGCVAIISGRSAEQVDAMMHPLRLPLSGLHGAQWRGADGLLQETALPPGQVQSLFQALGDLAQQHPGTLVEHKGLSVALHYRTAPQHGASVQAKAEQLATRFKNVFELQTGKMVVEFKPRGSDKGKALQRFLDEPVFRDRIPFMAGDDTTDETAFEVANACGGITIRIGPGNTSAQYRLSTPQALARWLADLLQGRHEEAR